MIIRYRKLVICCFLSILFFSSCNNEKDIFEKLSGTLVIEEIEYKGVRYNDFPFFNVLTLKESKTNHPLIILPKSDDYEKETALCYLTKEKNGVFLRIDSKNEFFNGTYKVIFLKEFERKLLGVEFVSDDLYIRGFYPLKDFFVEGIRW